MRWIKITVVAVLAFEYASAQDYSGYSQKLNDHIFIDSPIHPIDVRQQLSYKSFIAPVVLITYGFICLRSDPIQDLNEDLKDEIWTENPHQKWHIDNYLQFAPAIAVYGLNIAGIKGKNNLFDRSMIYVLSNIIMNSSVAAVKKLTHEQRPDGSDYLSFPSGHTAEAFASAEFLYQEYRDVSPWYGIAGYSVAAGVGFLRMYNNKHWLNDVVAGAGFGVCSTKLAYWLYPKIKNLFGKHGHAQTMLMPSYNNGAFGLSFVHFY